MVLGLRGIPGVQGGVETHAEQLYPRLVRLGCDVEVIVRTPFTSPDVREFRGVRLRRLWAPRSTGAEAFVHSFLGTLYAAIKRPDVLHIHAVGPAIVTPIARALGLKVVVTHHGPDYERDKWRAFARFVIRTGERWGMRFSNARIAISRMIESLVRERYGRESAVIPNGVVAVDGEPGHDHAIKLGLTPGRYFVQVSRLVQEKRQLDLIAAFRKAAIPGWKLLLVGALDRSAYSRQVAAKADKDVILSGFLTGVPLQQAYASAGAFVLPSTHEGLPIALLEALSYGLPVLASDIPANLEVGLEPQHYFRVGDIDALADGLRRISEAPNTPAAMAARRRFVAERYDWNRIAEQTLEVYRSVA